MATTKNREESWWRSTRAFGRKGVLSAVELVAQPGVCAGCRKPFHEHDDAQLEACTATFEETQPSGAEA